MPKRKPGGRRNDHRTTLDGMMWVLKSGSPWRDMPERYGSWKSVYDRFRSWSADGTIDRVFKRLQYKLDEDGYIDWDVWCVNGSNVRAHISAAGASEASKKQAERVSGPRPWSFTWRVGIKDPLRDLRQRCAVGCDGDGGSCA